MPQGKFGPLHLTERRGRLKDAHRKEQHEQSIPDTLQRGVDLDDQRPNVAALEALRRGRQQRPNLGKFAVPAIQRIFQCSYDPVIADRKSPPCFDRKCHGGTHFLRFLLSLFYCFAGLSEKQARLTVKVRMPRHRKRLPL